MRPSASHVGLASVPARVVRRTGSPPATGTAYAEDGAREPEGPFAALGQRGFSGDGGPATQARLDHPWGIAIDAAGNVFFADNNNDRIRKANPDGIITTVAGTSVGGFSGDGGPATRARLDGAIWPALDGAGNLYFTDSHNHRVRKVDPNGIISTMAGTGQNPYAGDGVQAARGG